MRFYRMSARTLPILAVVAALFTGAVAFALNTTSLPASAIDVPTEIATRRPLGTLDSTAPPNLPSASTPESTTVATPPEPVADPAAQEPVQSTPPTPPAVQPSYPAEQESEDAHDEDREVVSPPVREYDDESEDVEHHEYESEEEGD